MAGDPSQRPIIIKKVKKGGHGGHHGGAWKVAYADFVTAMMAFFLLLWLLTSVNKSKLTAIAEYFTPTIGLKDQMGIGFNGGETPQVEGKSKSNTATPNIVVGAQPQGPLVDDPRKQSVTEDMQDAKLFENAQEAMQRAFESDPNMRDLSDSVIVEQRPEGLEINVMDSDKHPMFEPGKIELSEHGQTVMRKLAPLIEKMPNFISITGHTDRSPLQREASYTNWELSADRANASRRYLIRVGVRPEKVQKIVGMADRELKFIDRPESPKNRRISIILLRGAYLNLQEGATASPRSILSIPNAVPGNQPARLVPGDKEMDRPSDGTPAAKGTMSVGAGAKGTDSLGNAAKKPVGSFIDQ